jgi:putative PIN family toxin of toxin-antitoxin system
VNDPWRLPNTIVIDTNVWISGIFFKGGAPAAVLRAWRDQRFDVVLTPEILDELLPKLRQKSLQFGADETLAEDWIGYIRTYASVIPASITVEDVCRDPDDDIFLAAALSGDADYIVSGDRDLQVLDEYQHVKVLSPKAFTDLLAREHSGRA